MGIGALSEERPNTPESGGDPSPESSAPVRVPEGGAIRDTWKSELFSNLHLMQTP
jgi:hypothetical protein